MSTAVYSEFAELVSYLSESSPFWRVIISQIPSAIIEAGCPKTLMMASIETPAQVFYDDLIELASANKEKGMDREEFEVLMDYFKEQAIKNLYSWSSEKHNPTICASDFTLIMTVTATYLILQQAIATCNDEENINPHINNLVVKELGETVFKLIPNYMSDLWEDAKYGIDECSYDVIEGLIFDVLHEVFGCYDEDELGEGWDDEVLSFIFPIFEATCEVYSRMISCLEWYLMNRWKSKRTAFITPSQDQPTLSILIMSTETFTITFDDEAFSAAEACVMYHEGCDFPEEYAEGFSVLFHAFYVGTEKTITFTDYVWECFKSFVNFHDQEEVPEEYWDGFDTLQAMFDEPEAFACWLIL